MVELMPNFKRRHFEGLARLLGSCKVKEELAESFAEFLMADNPAFDNAKFYAAIDNAWGKEWKIPE